MHRKTCLAVQIDLRECVCDGDVGFVNEVDVGCEDVGGMFYFSDVVFHFVEDFMDFGGVAGEDFEGFGVDGVVGVLTDEVGFVVF